MASVGLLLTGYPVVYTICSHDIETIGEAFSRGWRVVARCVRVREDGPSSKSSRECRSGDVGPS